jgi:hypothetical protein
MQPPPQSLVGELLSRLSAAPDTMLDAVQARPAFGWALIGIPIAEIAQVQKLLEALPPHAIVRTSFTDRDGGAGESDHLNS